MKIFIYKHDFLFILLILCLIININQADAATRFAVANGAWNSTTTWASSSGGSSGQSIPIAGDVVWIGESTIGRAVTIPSGYTAICTTLNIGSSSIGTNTTNSSLTLSTSNAGLNVIGNMTIYRGGNSNALMTFNVNAGTAIVSGSLTYGGSTSSSSRIIKTTITTGTLTLGTNFVFTSGSGNVTNVLDMSGGAGTFSLGGTMTNASVGTFTPGTTSTVDYNSVSAQTAASFNYANLTLSGGGTKTLATGTTAITGNFTIAGNSTVVTAVVDLAIGGNIVIGSGGTTSTFSAATFTHTIGGSWTNNGTFNANSSTISFTTAALGKTIGGNNATTYNNLILNCTNGVSINSAVDVTVNGVLNFTSGVFTTTTNQKLILGSAASVSRTSGHVKGNFQKNFATGSNVTRNFEVGDAAAANYAPVSVTFASVTTAGNLVASTIIGDHNLTGSVFNGSNTINRYWSLSSPASGGVVFTNYSAIFNYLSIDKDLVINTATVFCGKYDLGVWTYPIMGILTGTSAQITGVTSFSDYQFGDAQIPGPVYNSNSSSLFLRAANCTTSTAITSMATNGRLYATLNSGSCNGFNWIKVDVVGNHYISSPSFLYCAIGTTYMQSITANYIEVSGAPSGLFVRSAPGGSNLWVNNDYATIENGQRFITTGSTQILNGITWYQIYVSTNVKSSINGVSQPTAWVSGQYLIYSNPNCPPPSAPNALSPSNVTSNSFSANWSSVPSAVAYFLEVSTNSSFSSFVSGYNGINVGNNSSYIVSGLMQGVNYFYRLKAVNSCFGLSGYSTSGSCQTGINCTPPAAPVLNTILQGAITSSEINLSWNSVIGATGYDVHYSSNSCPGNGGTVLTTTSTSITIIGLIGNTTYYFVIYSKNTPSCISLNGSNCQQATTLFGCTPVAITINPVNRIISAPSQATFNVNASGTNPFYQWQESTNGGSTWTNVPNTHIPDNNSATGLSSSISVSGVPVSISSITNLSVTINISHSKDNDIEVYLIRPGGTISTLTNGTFSNTITQGGSLCLVADRGGSGDDFTNTVFSDAAVNSISTGSAPFTGTFKPEIPFNTLTGNPNGNWILKVLDDASGTSGTLISWSITMVLINGTSYTWSSNSSTLSIDPTSSSMNGYQYRCVVSNSCTSPLTSTSAILTVNSSTLSTITINSATVQPWQRANEASIEVSANCSTSDASQWKIIAFNPNNLSNPISSPNYSSGTIETWQVPVSFYNAPTEPNAIYYLVVSAGINPGPSKSLDIYGKTKIIEGNWDRKNIVLFCKQGEELKIPVKYISGATRFEVGFERIKLLSTSNESLIPYSPTMGCLFGLDFCDVYNNSDGYLHIPWGLIYNNNLVSIAPGGFKFTIAYFDNSFTSVGSEFGYFDLTKIGSVDNSYTSASNRNKIVVLVAGMTNEIENDISLLNNNSINSLDGWSIAKDLVQSNYNTWYFAQGNLNSVQKNAYNIGIALGRIRDICLSNGATNPEIHVICHSKGGLEMRVMMDGKGEPMKPSDNFISDDFTENPTTPFLNTNINNSLKSVSFLATPHQGISDYAIYFLKLHRGGGNQHNDATGWKDLKNTSKVISYLKQGSNVPTGIRIANITGHHHPKTGVNNIGGDGGVPQWSSENPSINGASVLKQYYIKSNIPNTNPIEDIYKLLHTNIHTSYVLNDVTDACIECHNFLFSYTCNSGIINTLNRIKAIIDDINIAADCPKPDESKTISIITTSSVLSNSFISIKKSNVYVKFAITDENGRADIPLNELSLGDTIKIDASGKESIYIPIDSNILITGKISVAMFSSVTPTSRIQYPVVKLTNQNFITNQSVIDLTITSINTISNQINSPHNQDSIFVPISLISGHFYASLDSGYNNILIRFIGSVDTVTISKEVYYFPVSLANENATNLPISTTPSYFGVKLYIDNQYVQDIISNSSVIKILKGNQEAKFSLFGYCDTVFNIANAGIINLSMQPIVYSSETDSAIIDFDAHGDLQYWKNITVKRTNNASGTKVILKQCADTLPPLGLIPKSRCFDFRNYSLSGYPIIKTAICLDQSTKLSKDSIYLLITKNDSIYTKALFDSTTCDFDSIVQKLTFNNLDFDFGQVSTEEIRIMKRLAPVVINHTFTINQNDSLTIPLQSLFTDPDSLKNDIIYQIGNVGAGITVFINNDSIKIKAVTCYAGNTTFNLKAIHDGLIGNNSINITVGNPPTATSTGTACTGGTIQLNATGGVSYSWTGPNAYISTIQNPSISNATTTNSGTYTVSITNNNGCINNISLVITVDFNSVILSGSNDQTFNIGTGFSGSNSFLHTLEIQSDGKILAGGGFNSFNGVNSNCIIRLNSDGTIDNTFNSGSGFNNDVYTFAIQSDGKIIAGGIFTSYNGETVNRIVRINTDGSLDNSFNSGTGFNNSAEGIVIQQDGKIIVVGAFTSYNGTGINRIIRLLPDGTMDSNNDFHVNTGFNNVANSIILQPDGKIIVGGWFTDFRGYSRNNITRINPDGTIDNSFNPGTGFNSYVNSIALQEDGKIVTGGLFTSFNGTNRNYIARLNSDGTLDNSFSMGTGFNNLLYSIYLQADGKIIVGGDFNSLNGVPIKGIARLNSNGSVDNTFNSGTGFNDQVICIKQQNDGKIIAGGNFTSYNNLLNNKIARLNNNLILTTSISPVSTYCSGSSLNVSYIAYGIFNCNIFTAQLSNSSGNFINPINIGSLTSTISGTIIANIPPNISPGNGYRIRVVSSSPEISSMDNGMDIIFNSPPLAYASSNGPFCSGDTIRLFSSGGESYSWTGPNGFTSAQQNPIILNSSLSTTGIYTVIVSDTNYSWTRKANFPGAPRTQSIGFSIGSTGYMGTGENSDMYAYYRDMYAYHPSTDSWQNLLAIGIGGGGYYGSVGFSIGSKGYLGTGDNQGATTVFWEYDTTANIWTQKANFAGSPRLFAVGFSIGDKGYIGTGCCHLNDFWEYNSLSNTWTQKANFGGGDRRQAVGFSIGNKGYIGTGYDDNSNPSFTKDFWEYNPNTDSWTRKADFPGDARGSAVGFSIGNNGYIGTGNCIGSIAKNDFWKYDPLNDTWEQKENFPGGIRWGATGFSVGSKGYIGTGFEYYNNNNYQFKNDFWEYSSISTCSASATTTVSVNVGSVVSGNDGPKCEGSIINLIASGGNSYSWTGPNNFQSTLQNPALSNATIADTGIYTVKVANNNGCSSISVPTKVIINPNPNLLLAVTNVNCKGENNGAVSVNVSSLGGTAPYSYLWSTGEISPTISGLFSGGVSLVIRDSNDCRADTNFSISEPDLITSSFPNFSTYSGGYNVSCHGATNGFVELFVNGGTPPYSFLWNGGLYNTENISSVPANNYSVVITDSHGCSKSDSIILTEPPLLNIAISSPEYSPGYNIACNGESSGKIFSEVSGGIQPFSLNWNGPNGFSSSDANLEGLIAGNYSVTVSDANSCTGSGLINLTQPNSISPLIQNTNINGVNVRCFNGSDGFAYVDSVIGGVPPFEFLWSNGITDNIIRNISSGNYTVHVKDANGCAFDKSIFLNQPDPVTTHLNISDYDGYGVSCNGLTDGYAVLDSIFGGVAPYSYSWSTGSNSDSIGGLSSGAYYFIVTDNNNCSDTFNISILDPPITACQLFLNLKVFLEGFYVGSNTMNAVVNPLGSPSLCDTITVELHESFRPYNLVYADYNSININGTGNFIFPRRLLGSSYYIVVKHRNSLQTWSKNPVSFNDTIISYDFSDANNKAYGNNMSELGDGNYALYSGDLNQDGIINLIDFSELENYLDSFLSGYLRDDLTGDWLIESSDFSLIENNLGRILMRP